MKKFFTFFRESKMKGLLSLLPLVVMFPLAVPAWSANVAVSHTSEKWPVASEAWPSEAWPETETTTYPLQAWPNETVPVNAWPSQGTLDAITLRTVILHRADGQNANVISAELVSVDDKYMILYEGNLYEITPLAGNPRYDSLVNIDTTYQFRMKLYPYE